MSARFNVFAGDEYYPSGGWDDYVGSYATVEQASRAAIDNLKVESSARWAHITYKGVKIRAWKQDWDDIVKEVEIEA